MKKVVYLVVAVLLAAVAMPASALAHDFKVGDLYYSKVPYKTGVVMVTYKGEGYPKKSSYPKLQAVNIPQTITVKGKTYKVTGIDDNAFDIFHPVDHLQERIRQVTAGFGEGTTGVHIRRTDNVRATLLSPTSLFIERMKQEPDTQRFYLATDSENVKAEMKQIFGDRIITPSDKAERGSLAGMENALVEMYSLAATSRIIGTVASTYSMTAAAIGKIQLEVLEAETNDLNL